MQMDQIITTIVANIPVVVAVFGEVIVFAKTISQYKSLSAKYNSLIAEVKDRTAMNALVEEMKAENAVIRHENAELKKTLREVLEKLDKVKLITEKE